MTGRSNIDLRIRKIIQNRSMTIVCWCVCNIISLLTRVFITYMSLFYLYWLSLGLFTLYFGESQRNWRVKDLVSERIFLEILLARLVSTAVAVMEFCVWEELVRSFLVNSIYPFKVEGLLPSTYRLIGIIFLWLEGGWCLVGCLQSFLFLMPNLLWIVHVQFYLWSDGTAYQLTLTIYVCIFLKGYIVLFCYWFEVI